MFILTWAIERLKYDGECQDINMRAHVNNMYNENVLEADITVSGWNKVSRFLAQERKARLINDWSRLKFDIKAGLTNSIVMFCELIGISQRKESSTELAHESLSNPIIYQKKELIETFYLTYYQPLYDNCSGTYGDFQVKT